MIFASFPGTNTVYAFLNALTSAIGFIQLLNPIHGLCKPQNLQFSCLYGIGKILKMIAVAVRHLHIHSCPDAGRKIHTGPPVAHDKPFIAPSVPQNIGQQFLVFTGWYTIQIIVAGHNRSRSCSLHRLFKSCQINLVHSPLIDHGIRSHAVGFLIIPCKVLQ